jgi:hypothetical protein
MKAAMKPITKIAPIPVDPAQRARWQSRNLALEWRQKFPDLFDDDDLRIAKSQPNIHFYEWLGAIVLHHTTGYLSLVEKYEFATHPRKQQIVAQLLRATYGMRSATGARAVRRRLTS